MTAMSKSFFLRESLYERHANRLKEWMFRRLTRDALPLFLKGGDNISIAPLVQGFHEKRIVHLINGFAAAGYGDFLIDIGANIGLVSCQSGDHFRQVHMYEPNPKCCSILEINVGIALSSCQTYLHPIGLGTRQETVVLHVPKYNWGGAFVLSQDNSYDEAQLASKDGYARFNSDNYMRVDIRLEPAVDELRRLFQGLFQSGCRAGVIKIDVEGCEIPIVEAIAETLPPDFKLMIVFEYFDRNFSPESLLEKFKGRADAMKLVRTPAKSMARLKRFFQILSHGYAYVLRPFSPNDSATDIVLEVKEANISR